MADDSDDPRRITEGGGTEVEGTEVSSLELFFDVVFVFAVSQLSAHLVHVPNWRGLAEMLVMLVGVFLVWTYTAFEVTLTHGRPGRTRAMMLLVMVLGLFMNASIGHAFEDGALAFVLPMLVVQIGRTIYSTLPTAPGFIRHHYFRMLGWQVIAAPLWVAGALVDSDLRLAWWAGAAGLDLIGTWLAHPLPGRRLESRHMPFDGAHMLERLRLFLIIALGEIVYASGMAVSRSGVDVDTWSTGVSAAVVVISLWSLYFAASDPVVAEHTETTADPLRATRLAANGMVVTVGGLIAIAAANESAITHPGGPTGAFTAALMFGGAAAYLLVQTWHLHHASGTWSKLRLFAIGVLAVSAFVAPSLRKDASAALLAMQLALMAVLVVRDQKRAPITAVDPEPAP